MTDNTKSIVYPTIELTATHAYLRYAGLPQLEFEWPLYPDTFAGFMSRLQPEHGSSEKPLGVVVTKLVLV